MLKGRGAEGLSEAPLALAPMLISQKMRLRFVLGSSWGSPACCNPVGFCLKMNNAVCKTSVNSAGHSANESSMQPRMHWISEAYEAEATTATPTRR
jgi:hypothetical protein